MKRYCKNIRLDKDWIMACMLECFSELENRGDNIYDALTDIDGLLNFDKLLGLP